MTEPVSRSESGPRVQWWRTCRAKVDSELLRKRQVNTLDYLSNPNSIEGEKERERKLDDALSQGSSPDLVTN